MVLVQLDIEKRIFFLFRTVGLNNDVDSVVILPISAYGRVLITTRSTRRFVP